MSKKNSRKSYLLKNTLIFAISNMATKLIVFLLIPIYTCKLSTSEYGIADLLFTICNFVYPLLTLNIVESVFRFSMDKEIDKSKIVNIGFMCNIICFILGLTSIPILKYMTPYGNIAVLFYFHLIMISTAQVLLAFLKGQEKLKLFAIGNILNTILIAVFSIVFLILFKMNITGYFLSYILSNLVTIIYTIIVNNDNVKFNIKKIDKKLTKKMLKYSVVLMPTTFLWWVVNSSDKIMITSMISSASVGIYAISYKFPSLLTMIGSIFNQAWVFSAINENKSKDYENYVNGIFRNLFLILSLSAMFLLIIIKPLLRIYVSKDYFIAWKYVPYLAVGYIFMTASTFLSASYNVHKDSKGFLYSALIGAITNIALNFILIPNFGVHGAALATMISYIVIFIYRLFDTKKYVNINLNGFHLYLLVITIAMFALTYFTGIYALIIQILLFAFTMYMYRKTVYSALKSIISSK